MEYGRSALLDQVMVHFLELRVCAGPPGFPWVHELIGVAWRHAIVTPVLLGGVRDRMMGTQMYQEVIQTFNFQKASMLAFLLLLAGLAVVLPLQMLERKLSRFMDQRGS